jgi:hypothetical protein
MVNSLAVFASNFAGAMGFAGKTSALIGLVVGA